MTDPVPLFYNYEFLPDDTVVALDDIVVDAPEEILPQNRRSEGC